MTYWWCQCDCVNKTIKMIYSNSLQNGDTQSCGCLYKYTSTNLTKHKLSHTVEYNIWKAIKNRCYNTNFVHYKDYGGRGVKMCERWLNNPELFIEDMGPRPSEKYSIERIDNNKDYCPENCRWATRKEQANNRRNNVYLEYNNEKLTVSQWGERLNLRPSTISKRIQLGWCIEDILKNNKD